MRYVPWHVKGVRPEVREAAREAARRSGLSVGAWLNSLIVDAAAGGHWRSASFDPVFRSTSIDDAGVAEIRKDIDELKQQMSRPQRDREIFERRLHEIEARINAVQSSTRCDDGAEALRQQFGEFDKVGNAPGSLQGIVQFLSGSGDVNLLQKRFAIFRKLLKQFP